MLFFPSVPDPTTIWNSLDGKKILATEKWPSPIDFDHPIFYRTREMVRLRGCSEETWLLIFDINSQRFKKKKKKKYN